MAAPFVVRYLNVEMLMLMALLRRPPLPRPIPRGEKPSENKSLARLITTDGDAAGPAPVRLLTVISPALGFAGKCKWTLPTRHLLLCVSRSTRLPIFCTLPGLSSAWVSRCRLSSDPRRLFRVPVTQLELLLLAG